MSFWVSDMKWVKVDADTYYRVLDYIYEHNIKTYPLIDTHDVTVYVDKDNKPLVKVYRWQCGGFVKGRPKICCEYYVDDELLSLVMKKPIK